MRIKTILLFAVLTATSLSIWGQCKLSPYTQQFVETVRKENISDVQRLKSAYYFTSALNAVSHGPTPRPPAKYCLVEELDLLE